MNSNKHIKKIISILVFIAIICTFFSGCSKSSTNIHRRLNVIQSCSNADILEGGREIIAYDVDTGVMYLICNGHYKFGITALLGQTASRCSMMDMTEKTDLEGTKPSNSVLFDSRMMITRHMLYTEAQNTIRF